MTTPLFVIKIAKYCDVGGGGGAHQNHRKDNGAILSVIKIGKYYGVWVGGGGAGIQITLRLLVS